MYFTDMYCGLDEEMPHELRSEPTKVAIIPSFQLLSRARTLEVADWMRPTLADYLKGVYAKPTNLTPFLGDTPCWQQARSLDGIAFITIIITSQDTFNRSMNAHINKVMKHCSCGECLEQIWSDVYDPAIRTEGINGVPVVASLVDFFGIRSSFMQYPDTNGEIMTTKMLARHEKQHGVILSPFLPERPVKGKVKPVTHKPSSNRFQ